MKNTLIVAVTAVLLAHGAFAATYFTGFEEGNIISYVGGTVLESNIVWTFSSALSGTLSADNKDDIKCVRMARNNVGGTEASIRSQVITGSFGILSFKYA